MHPADDHTLLARHDCCQHLGATRHTLALREGSIIGRIPRADRRGEDHKLRITNQFRSLRGCKHEPLPAQALDFLGVDLVGTADPVTECEQQGGNPAHS